MSGYLNIYQKAGIVATLLVMLCAQFGCGSSSLATKPKSVFANTGPPKDSSRIANKKYLRHLPYNFQVPADNDDLAWRYIAEQGAVYVAQGGVNPPPTMQFPSAEQTDLWQKALPIERFEYGEEKYGNYIELQANAMAAYKAARAEVESIGMSLTPRGPDSARRTFDDTVKLWQTRVNAGLDHWVLVHRMTKADADRIRGLSFNEQVLELLHLEGQGMFFGSNFSSPILSSVAAPGTSQHLSLLALDFYEYENYDVRLILIKHGWFQTIPTDLPHFTYLGVKESQLPELGLKRIISSERAFWVPDVK